MVLFVCRELDRLGASLDPLQRIRLTRTQTSRTPENAIPIVTQKSLVGHSKGRSAAWQMIGLLQSVNTGIIPGNRSGGGVGADFRKCTYLIVMFLSKSIHTDGIPAGIMSSFGFGQVGGIALAAHPCHLLTTLEPATYEAYKERNCLCYLQPYKAMSEMTTHNSLVKLKDSPTYTPDVEADVLLNLLARATLSSSQQMWHYGERGQQRRAPSLLQHQQWNHRPAPAQVRMLHRSRGRALSTPDISTTIIRRLALLQRDWYCDA